MCTWKNHERQGKCILYHNGKNEMSLVGMGWDILMSRDILRKKSNRFRVHFHPSSSQAAIPKENWYSVQRSQS